MQICPKLLLGLAVMLLLLSAHPSMASASVTSKYEAQDIEKHYLDSLMKATPGQLSVKQFNALSPMGKVLYAVYYPESYTQSCDGYLLDSTKVYGYWSGSEGASQSERQQYVLKKYHRQLYELLGSVAERSDRLNLKYLELTTDYKVWEMVPTLVALYRTSSNLTYITALLQVMKNARYKPFLRSKQYKRIYESSSDPFSTGVRLLPTSIEAILSLAQDFYTEQLKKK